MNLGVIGYVVHLFSQKVDAMQTHRYVWDLPLRLFHWALVICVIGAFGSGKAGVMAVHERFALTVLGLLLFRIIWGFLGGETARFSHFLASPAAAFSDIKAIIARTKNRHYGHSALSGYAVIALLIVPLLLVISGLFSSDDVLFDGPLAHLAPEMVNQATRWHHYLHPVIVALFLLHLLAMLTYRLRLKINLVRPMITGASVHAAKQMPALSAQRQIAGLGIMALSILATHMLPLLRPALF